MKKFPVDNRPIESHLDVFLLLLFVVVHHHHPDPPPPIITIIGNGGLCERHGLASSVD